LNFGNCWRTFMPVVVCCKLMVFLIQTRGCPWLACSICWSHSPSFGSGSGICSSRTLSHSPAVRQMGCHQRTTKHSTFCGFNPKIVMISVQHDQLDWVSLWHRLCTVQHFPPQQNWKQFWVSWRVSCQWACLERSSSCFACCSL
jgi:hypothetical protein